MNYEILSIVGLSLSLIGLMFYFQAFKHKQEKSIDAIRVSVSTTLNEFDKRIETLVTETREAIRDTVSKVQGLNDHITTLSGDYKALQHETAEFTASMDPDIVSKLQDRLALVEMTVGVRRIDQARKVASEKA